MKPRQLRARSAVGLKPAACHMPSGGLPKALVDAPRSPVALFRSQQRSNPLPPDPPMPVLSNLLLTRTFLCQRLAPIVAASPMISTGIFIPPSNTLNPDRSHSSG